MTNKTSASQKMNDFAMENKGTCLTNHPPETQGVTTPHDILPDGIDETVLTNPWTGESTKVRKGTVAAGLSNIENLNRMLSSELPDDDWILMKNIRNELARLLPTFKAAGLFDLFPVVEWLKDKKQPGKALMGLLYIQENPEIVSDKIKNIMESMDGKIVRLACNQPFPGI